MSPITCQMSLTPKAIATDPPFYLPNYAQQDVLQRPTNLLTFAGQFQIISESKLKIMSPLPLPNSNARIFLKYQFYLGPL